MADNIDVTPGSGKTVAGDDVAGVLYQRVKVSVGADGSATDASSGLGATDAGTLRIVSASDTPEITNLGSLTETAPATDTASSGLNGRLQRIAQRLTSLIALLPTALGTGGGLKVDGSGTALPISVADGSDVAEGAKADAAYAGSGSASIVAILKGLYAAMVAATPTGSNVIGGVTIADGSDVAEGAKADSAYAGSGSASVVSILKGLYAAMVAATPAGTNVIGKVAVDQTTPGTTNKVYLTDINAGSYETVAASQTDQVMGSTGATGDYLAGVLIVPGTTSPGAVSIKDGSGSAITIFTGGATSVSSLVPFMVPFGIKSTGGAWKITTGTNVSAIGVGNFT